MSQLFRRPRMHFYITLGLVALAAILRTVSFFVCFDADIGYFASGAALPTLYYIGTGLALAWAVAAFFVLPKEALGEESLTLSALVGRGTASATALLCALLLLLSMDSIALPVILPILTVLLLAGTVAYLMLPVLSEKGNRELQLATGYCVLFAAVLLLAPTYFDRYTQMNAPHKAGGHLALLSLMPAILFALRRLVGRTAPRAEFAVTSLSLYLCATMSLPNIIAFLAGIYQDKLYLAVDVFLLGFACFLATRLAAISSKD